MLLDAPSPHSDAFPQQPGEKLGLVAGEGELPLHVAQFAMRHGWDVHVYGMDVKTLSQLSAWVPVNRLFHIRPGLLNKNFALVQSHQVSNIVFAGKVNKWILLRSPVFDSRAWSLWKQQTQFNDDAIMLRLIQEFEEEGLRFLRQTDFLQDFFLPPGVYSQQQPTHLQQADIEFGFSLAKEMGRLDIGQTVVVSNGMVLAIEAIEGTDQAILRSKKWAGKSGGVVVKVEKPGQDLRFDVPTIGPRTLKAMKKAGLSVLAFEAQKTFVLQREELIRLANRWNMVLVGR